MLYVCTKCGQNWLRNARQKSKMAATKFSFFDISTSARGDFPRIIEIALFVYMFCRSRACRSIFSFWQINLYVIIEKQNEMAIWLKKQNLLSLHY